MERIVSQIVEIVKRKYAKELLERDDLRKVWEGQDKWYHFDASGVMGLGWYQENGKIYYLQEDITDNWYGRAVTGTQTINGITYNFDVNTRALIP